MLVKCAGTEREIFTVSEENIDKQFQFNGVILTLQTPNVSIIVYRMYTRLDTIIPPLPFSTYPYSFATNILSDF